MVTEPSNPFEKPYVVYTNFVEISPNQAVFEFKHPNEAAKPVYNMYKQLEFIAQDDFVMHAFGGYFETVLIDDVLQCNSFFDIYF